MHRERRDGSRRASEPSTCRLVVCGVAAHFDESVVAGHLWSGPYLCPLCAFSILYGTLLWKQTGADVGLRALWQRLGCHGQWMAKCCIRRLSSHQHIGLLETVKCILSWPHWGQLASSGMLEYLIYFLIEYSLSLLSLNRKTFSPM